VATLRSRHTKALNIAHDPEITEPVKIALTQALLAQPKVLQNDRLVYRIVVSGLALIGVSALGFAFVLAITGRPEQTTYGADGKVITSKIPRDQPAIFVALGSAAVAALAGLLAPSPKEADAASRQLEAAHQQQSAAHEQQDAATDQQQAADRHKELLAKIEALMLHSQNAESGKPPEPPPEVT